MLLGRGSEDTVQSRIVPNPNMRMLRNEGTLIQSHPPPPSELPWPPRPLPGPTSCAQAKSRGFFDIWDEKKECGGVGMSPVGSRIKDFSYLSQNTTISEEQLLQTRSAFHRETHKNKIEMEKEHKTVHKNKIHIKRGGGKWPQN